MSSLCDTSATWGHLSQPQESFGATHKQRLCRLTTKLLAATIESIFNKTQSTVFRVTISIISLLIWGFACKRELCWVSKLKVSKWTGTAVYLTGSLISSLLNVYKCKCCDLLKKWENMCCSCQLADTKTPDGAK